MPESGPLYVQGNPNSPVAICTLSSHSLLKQLAASPLIERVSIIGRLETANLGIERLLTSLLALPHIRWLVICGDESRHRRQGQALRNLLLNGVGPDGQIRGASSKNARLPTLRPADVETVRHQVGVRDLLGVHDFERIGAAVADCLAQPVAPLAGPARAPPPDPAVVEVAPGAFRLRALDPNGFFVILVDRPAGRLVVEHYGNDGVLRHRLAGQDADSLSQALVEWGLISRLDHAAYLGRELARAEAAFQFGFEYRQDEGLEPISGVDTPSGAERVAPDQ